MSNCDKLCRLVVGTRGPMRALLMVQCHPGTTTATVLTRAIFAEGAKSVAAGMNPMDLRRGINVAVEAVVRNLKSRAKMISTTEEIAQVTHVHKEAAPKRINCTLQPHVSSHLGRVQLMIFMHITTFRRTANGERLPRSDGCHPSFGNAIAILIFSVDNGCLRATRICTKTRSRSLQSLQPAHFNLAQLTMMDRILQNEAGLLRLGRYLQMERPRSESSLHEPWSELARRGSSLSKYVEASQSDCPGHCIKAAKATRWKLPVPYQRGAAKVN